MDSPCSSRLPTCCLWPQRCRPGFELHAPHGRAEREKKRLLEPSGGIRPPSLGAAKFPRNLRLGRRNMGIRFCGGAISRQTHRDGDILAATSFQPSSAGECRLIATHRSKTPVDVSRGGAEEARLCRSHGGVARPYGIGPSRPTHSQSQLLLRAPGLWPDLDAAGRSGPSTNQEVRTASTRQEALESQDDRRSRLVNKMLG